MFSLAPGTCACFCTPLTLSCGLNRSCQQCVGQGRRMQQSDVERGEMTCITLAPKGRGTEPKAWLRLSSPKTVTSSYLMI